MIRGGVSFFGGGRRGAATVVLFSCDELGVYSFRRHGISHEQGLPMKTSSPTFFFFSMCLFLCHPSIFCYHFSCTSSCGAARPSQSKAPTVHCEIQQRLTGFVYKSERRGVCTKCPHNIMSIKYTYISRNPVVRKLFSLCSSILPPLCACYLHQMVFGRACCLATYDKISHCRKIC